MKTNGRVPTGCVTFQRISANGCILRAGPDAKERIQTDARVGGAACKTE